MRLITSKIFRSLQSSRIEGEVYQRPSINSFCDAEGEDPRLPSVEAASLSLKEIYIFTFRSAVIGEYITRQQIHISRFVSFCRSGYWLLLLFMYNSSLTYVIPEARCVSLSLWIAQTSGHRLLVSLRPPRCIVSRRCLFPSTRANETAIPCLFIRLKSPSQGRYVVSEQSEAISSAFVLVM